MNGPALERDLPHFVSRTLSRKTGILKGLRLLYRAPGEAPIFTGIGELPDLEVIFRSKGEVSGTGVGLAPGHALMAAMGEALEGYSSYESLHPVISASYRELTAQGEDAVSPFSLPLYSKTQYADPDFPFQPFTDDVKLGWIKGRCISSGEEKYIPADQVYIAYKPEAGVGKICHSIFGGVACGISHKRALLSAIYEVIERDAMMIWWLNQLPMPRVVCDDIHISSMKLHDFAKTNNISIETWSITMDIPVPVFFSLMTDKATGAIAGGFGTNLHPKTAFLKSIYECVQNRLGQLPMRHDWGRDLYNEKMGFTVLGNVDETLPLEDLARQFSASKNLYSNLQFYLYPQTHGCLEAVKASDHTIRLEQAENKSSGAVEADLEYCLQLLKERGFAVIMTDLTVADMAELGFVNLRVNIPGLVSNSVCAWPYLGNNRLYDVPTSLGFPGKTEREITRLPIPYA